MGKIEEGVKKRAKKQNIQRAVLSVVGIAGLLAVTMVAPNVMQLLKYTPLGKNRGSVVNNATRRLEERGELEWVSERGHRFARLTRKGQVRLARLTSEATIVRKRRWDKRWRIVIFDIPEERRRSRDLLRQTLAAIGFFKLQHSVWVYPYDCEDFIALLKTDFAIGKQVLYIVSEHVEGDSKLRKHFNLPSA